MRSALLCPKSDAAQVVPVDASSVCRTLALDVGAWTGGLIEKSADPPHTHHVARITGPVTASSSCWQPIQVICARYCLPVRTAQRIEPSSTALTVRLAFAAARAVVFVDGVLKLLAKSDGVPPADSPRHVRCGASLEPKAVTKKSTKTPFESVKKY